GAQRVKEQGSRHAVRQASGGVDRLVLQVEVDAPVPGELDLEDVRFGGGGGVGLQQPYCVLHPGAVASGVVVLDPRRRGSRVVFSLCRCYAAVATPAPGQGNRAAGNSAPRRADTPGSAALVLRGGVGFGLFTSGDREGLPPLTKGAVTRVAPARVTAGR